MANETKAKHGEHNISLQRAAILGLVCNILNKDEADITVKQIKIAIINVLGDLIENDHMVGDFIDLHVAKCCASYIEKQKAVEDAQDIVEKGS